MAWTWGDDSLVNVAWGLIGVGCCVGFMVYDSHWRFRDKGTLTCAGILSLVYFIAWRFRYSVKLRDKPKWLGTFIGTVVAAFISLVVSSVKKDSEKAMINTAFATGVMVSGVILAKPSQDFGLLTSALLLPLQAVIARHGYRVGLWHVGMFLIFALGVLWHLYHLELFETKLEEKKGQLPVVGGGQAPRPDEPTGLRRQRSGLDIAQHD